MSAIFTPSGEKEFFTPFGPMMGYVRIPPALVAHLNASMSEQLEDHSGSLVGKVRQELRFPKSLVDATAAALGNALRASSSPPRNARGLASRAASSPQEWAEDDLDHHPSHGHLQFAHGTDTHYSVSNFMIRPRVGDFYIFPSYMFHSVYPFKSPGERRSFSMNLSVVESPA